MAQPIGDKLRERLDDRGLGGDGIDGHNVRVDLAHGVRGGLRTRYERELLLCGYTHTSSPAFAGEDVGLLLASSTIVMAWVGQTCEQIPHPLQ
jgi:hypothetical protein